MRLLNHPGRRYSCHSATDVEHRAAIDDCQQALSLSKEIGSLYGQANTWDTLGYAHHHLGEHGQAIECYRQALGLLEVIGDAATARDAWRRALNTLDQLGHPDADKVRGKLR